MPLIVPPFLGYELRRRPQVERWRVLIPSAQYTLRYIEMSRPKLVTASIVSERPLGSSITSPYKTLPKHELMLDSYAVAFLCFRRKTSTYIHRAEETRTVVRHTNFSSHTPFSSPLLFNGRACGSL